MLILSSALRHAKGFAVVLFVLFSVAFQCNCQSHIPQTLNSRLTELRRDNCYDEAIKELEKYVRTLSIDSDYYIASEAKLIEADLYRIKGQTLLASNLLDSLAKSLSGKININDPLYGELHMVTGTLLLTRGELDKGYVEILKAIEIIAYNFGRKDTLLGPCYNKLGNYHYFRKNYDSALIYYKKALDMIASKSDTYEDKASYIQNIGIVHLEQNDYPLAEDCFLKALELKLKLYSPNNYSLGRLYLNLGKFYVVISAYDKAIIYLEKAEKIYCANDGYPHIELGKIYWNKGLIYHLTGDSESALAYLFNAKQIIDSVFTDNQALIASLNSDIANVYHNIGQNKKAIQYYNAALSGADDALRRRAYRNLGKLYTLEGDFTEAKAYFNKLNVEFKGTTNSRNPENALTWLHYGFFMLESENDSALLFLNKALELFNDNKGFHDREISAALYMIGDYYSNKDQLFEALNYYQRSLIAISRNFSDTGITALPAVDMLNPDIRAINALSKKADCLHKLYFESKNIDYLFSAISAYRICFDLVDQHRLNLKAENSQIYLQDGLDNIYNQAIESCLLAYNLTKDKQWTELAFNFSERCKSMVLLSELKDANAKRISYIPDSLTKKEKEFKGSINLYLNNIWEEENKENPDNKKLSYYQSNLLKSEKKYDSLINYLENRYPSYYTYKYDPSVVTVKKLQRTLDHDEVILEYSLAKDNIFIFAISPDVFDVKMIPADSAVIQEIFMLRDNLDFDHVFDYKMEDYTEFQMLAYVLYSKLILPVVDYLPGKKLIIIPDKELNYLSFEALIQKIIPSDTIAFRNLPYLIKSWPISYAPSSTIFTLIKKYDRPEIKEGVLAMAPSQNMLTRNMLINNSALLEMFKNDLDLPGATWEVEAILTIMKGKKLVGELATEAEFKRLASSFDILHFAAHTQIDDSNPLSSMLAFYPYANDGEDGVLHTYEIYNLDLKGELAVLSACSTGNGKLMRGEGVISLARAFAYAGMPSVVMTLWDVDDISTGNIVPYFYQLLTKGCDKDIALQLSKLRYLEITRPEIETHPAFWSGFVLYGNSRGFRQKTNNVYLILLTLMGSLIILISFVLFRKYFRFKKQLKRATIDLPAEFQPEDEL